MFQTPPGHLCHPHLDFSLVGHLYSLSCQHILRLLAVSVLVLSRKPIVGMLMLPVTPVQIRLHYRLDSPHGKHA